MTKPKTPEQVAEEWIITNHASDFGSTIDPVGGTRAAFLAGREHFIEHELQQYLEMARDGGYNGGLERFMFTYDNDEIIQKALEKI